MLTKFWIASLLLTATLVAEGGFLQVRGKDVVDADGSVFRISGVNLGHWLNPEGYMFGFKTATSPHLIDEAFRQMVGPEQADRFWTAFRENYVTEADIAFIASTGANTVRIPFNYRLFANDTGFRLIDRAVGWCARHRLRAILDMHACPGGQTGSNIDDSYGSAWLFESERDRRRFCNLWRKIARHYAAEPAVLGYDLMNEPISSSLPNRERLNALLEPLLKEAVAAIREEDRKHIVILGGAQWNTNFKPFADYRFDSNMMYECHLYRSAPTNVLRFVEFRDRTGLPMYMGETGHNKYGWYKELSGLMATNGIGCTWWPYKKANGGGWQSFPLPDDWDLVKNFVDGDRSTYKSILATRPDEARAARTLMQYAENCRFERCRPDVRYLRAIGLKPSVSTRGGEQ